MEWDGSLDTGVRRIDEQHRGLVALFNELEHAEGTGPEDVRRVLDTLTDYVASHFAMEEDLMRREGYDADAVRRHVAEHHSLTARTREQVLAYRAGELDSVEPLVGFLQQWLTHHISEVDGLLAAHVRSRRSEG